MGLIHRPEARALHVEGWELFLLGMAGFAMFYFVLEFFGTTLMNSYGTAGQVVGFVVAYPLACLAPIIWGWWLTHRKRQDHIRWRRERRR